MQHTSAIWKRLWADPNTSVDYKVIFDGISEFTSDICPPVTLARTTMQERVFGPGAVTSHSLNFSLRPQSTQGIRGGAKVELFVRLTLGNESSEWLPKGVFFVDNRKVTLDRIDFECVDAILRLDVLWVSGVSPEYNPPMRDALSDICELSDIEIANIDAIPEEYRTGNVNDLTRRQVVSFIASACGCDAALDELGKLRLYPLQEPGMYHDIGGAVASASEINDVITIKKVTVQYSEGEDSVISKGSGDIREELYLYNEWANEAIVADLYAKLKGYTYRPVSVQNAHIDPAFELGDGLIADGLKTQIINAVTRFDGHVLTSLQVPNDGVLGSETGRYIGAYDSDSERRINRLRTELMSVIVSCEHISTNGSVVTIRPTDENVTDIKGYGTYHFNLAGTIPGAPILRIVDHSGRQLASRRWMYTNGKNIRSIDIATGARVEARDSGEYFFSDASSGELEALFQDAIAQRRGRKIAIPGCGIGVRGSI